MLKHLIVRSAYLFLASTFIVTALCSTVKAQTPLETFKKLQWPFYDPGTGDSCSDSGTDSTGAPLTGRDNEQKTWNYFIAKGLSDKQVAGIMGNMQQESHFDPLIMQIGGRSKDPYDAGSLGWGIIQWSGNSEPTGDKVTRLFKQSGLSGQIYTLGTQLDLVWGHMQNKPPITKGDFSLDDYKKISDEKAAAVYFKFHIEGGTDPGGVRENNATSILKKYSGTATDSGSSGTNNGSNCTSSVGCNNGSGDNSASALSATRQNVVCIAQKELALWKSKPGYPNPAYSQNGYLKYSQGRKEEWCADFASWVYNQAGYALQQTPSWNIAYVPNIQAVGEQGGKFHWHPKSSSYTPKPGDLAIHGAKHVNIYISSSGGNTQYIGGDQGDSPYPGGSIVSIETGNGYYDNGITGYVSPD
jgi:hypothetical protein